MNIKPLLQSFWLRFQALLIALFILLLLFVLGKQLIDESPQVTRLDSVKVQLTQKNYDQSVVLGWQALGQRLGVSTAETRHLNVSLVPNATTKQSQWLLTNVASQRRVYVDTTQGSGRYLRRMALQNGDRLVSDDFEFDVKLVGKKLELFDRKNNVSAHWTGSRLAFSDNRRLYTACERHWLKAWFVESMNSLQWQGFFGEINTEKRLFTLGGQVDCTTRWRYKALQPDSIRFYWMDHRFWVGQGRNPSHLRLERGEFKQDLNNVSIQYDGEEGVVDSLILGRTHYAVSSTQKNNQYELILTPFKNQPVFFSSDNINASVNDLMAVDRNVLKQQQIEQEKDRLEKQKQLKDLNTQGIYPLYSKAQAMATLQSSRVVNKSNLVIAVAVSLFLTSLVILFKQGHHPIKYMMRFVALAITWTIAALFTYIAFKHSSLSMLLWLAWLSAVWATLLQFLSGRLYSTAAKIWYLTLLLSGVGLLVLAQLAAGSGNTRWLDFPTETAFWLMQIALWVALLTLCPLENAFSSLLSLLHPEKRLQLGKRIYPSWPHISFILLVILVVGLLGFQALLGKEEGVFGIQPVELAKLLFVIAMARILWFWRQMRLIHSSYFQMNRFRVALTLFGMLFLALLVAVFILMVGVNDHSPVFIVALLTLALLWMAFVDPLKANTKGQWLGQGALIGLLVLLVVSGIFIYFNPPDYNSLIPQSERLRIWSNPNLYPEAASQLLNSLEHIGTGGWTGLGWFSKNSIVMMLPAVQDDFIAAFLLNHFGGLLGIVLIVIQLLWLYTIFRLVSLLEHSRIHVEIDAAFRLLAYVLYGLAWLHVLHWVISWSNVLGWLPIMGQPMTWLSSGNSHLLALGASTLLLALLAAWAWQEQEKY